MAHEDKKMGEKEWCERTSGVTERMMHEDEMMPENEVVRQNEWCERTNGA
jgi:hypothetical protein